MDIEVETLAEVDNHHFENISMLHGCFLRIESKNARGNPAFAVWRD
jgi:hypothetical protein